MSPLFNPVFTVGLYYWLAANLGTPIGGTVGNTLTSALAHYEHSGKSGRPGLVAAFVSAFAAYPCLTAILETPAPGTADALRRAVLSASFRCAYLPAAPPADIGADLRPDVDAALALLALAGYATPTCAAPPRFPVPSPAPRARVPAPDPPGQERYPATPPARPLPRRSSRHSAARRRELPH